jgi:hypothetical protein
MLTVKVRFKAPDGDTSRKLEFPFRRKGRDVMDKADADTRFAAAVALFGMELRRPERRERQPRDGKGSCRAGAGAHPDDERLNSSTHPPGGGNPHGRGSSGEERDGRRQVAASKRCRSRGRGEHPPPFSRTSSPFYLSLATVSRLFRGVCIDEDAVVNQKDQIAPSVVVQIALKHLARLQIAVLPILSLAVLVEDDEVHHADVGFVRRAPCKDVQQFSRPSAPTISSMPSPVRSPERIIRTDAVEIRPRSGRICLRVHDGRRG